MTHALASPIADGERAEVLDALRGFALLGIFVSHVPDFSGYTFLQPSDQQALDQFGIDAPLAAAMDFLIRGKFFSLFSLLFGIGFAVQLESATRRGADFAAHFSRRLSVLLVIGLIHASLWYGDILKDYALIGFALILTARWGASSVAWAFGVVLAVRILWPFLISAAVPVLARGDGGDPGGDFNEVAQAFAGADIGAIFSANLDLVVLKALQLIYDGKALAILAMFLLGALIGKLQLYRNLEQHRPLLRRTLWVCAPVGVLANAVLVPLHASTPDFPPTVQWAAQQALFAVAAPALMLAYASGFALLWSYGREGLLRFLAPAGRMALTTYVSQSLLGIALFYGLGLGFGGEIGLAAGTLAALCIFALQCVFSAMWLAHFRFGPIEWVWRRATYGKPVPMRRRSGDSAAPALG